MILTFNFKNVHKFKIEIIAPFNAKFSSAVSSLFFNPHPFYSKFQNNKSKIRKLIHADLSTDQI